MKKLRLADMMVMLRGELMEAKNRASAQNLQFDVDEMELEIQFTTSLAGEFGGEADFVVVNAELAGSISRETVHTVRFKMKPGLRSGESVKISDKVVRPNRSDDEQ